MPLYDGRLKKARLKFLADEDCDSAIVRALREAGHDIKTIKEVMMGASDQEVISLALRESRILLTEDKDFGQLVFASTVESPGVILFRYPSNAREIVAKDAVKLAASAAGKIPKHFVVIQPGRVRITENPSREP